MISTTGDRAAHRIGRTVSRKARGAGAQALRAAQTALWGRIRGTALSASSHARGAALRARGARERIRAAALRASLRAWPAEP
ncbi:hypothetical protein [Actinocorallia herbida]|uniref:hypothetical protein n=1 Tax=Actinocorallia herbida TaxID=58109 RepID=UPI0011CDFB47|nr:hypothetical protein [Actinocorallia herbida]